MLDQLPLRITYTSSNGVKNEVLISTPSELLSFINLQGLSNVESVGDLQYELNGIHSNVNIQTNWSQS